MLQRCTWSICWFDRPRNTPLSSPPLIPARKVVSFQYVQYLPLIAHRASCHAGMLCLCYSHRTVHTRSLAAPYACILPIKTSIMWNDGLACPRTEAAWQKSYARDVPELSLTHSELLGPESHLRCLVSNDDLAAALSLLILQHSSWCHQPDGHAPLLSSCL